MMAVRRRPGLPREFIEASRRRSFALAAAEIAHESGVHTVTVALVCSRARSARKTFYEHFDNVEDTLRHGIREAYEHLFVPLRGAGTNHGEWLLGVDAAIARFYTAAAAEPLLTELLLVHSFGIPMGADERDFDAGVGEMMAMLDGGREEGSADSGPPPLAEEYLARVVISMAAVKVRQDEAGTLSSHAREMTMLVGNAYLGIERTTRILGSTEVGTQ